MGDGENVRRRSYLHWRNDDGDITALLDGSEAFFPNREVDAPDFDQFKSPGVAARDRTVEPCRFLCANRTDRVTITSRPHMGAKPPASARHSIRIATSKPTIDQQRHSSR